MPASKIKAKRRIPPSLASPRQQIDRLSVVVDPLLVHLLQAQAELLGVGGIGPPHPRGPENRSAVG